MTSVDYKALHSSSCCYYNSDLYIAFYAGERECVKQRVFVFKKEGNKFVLFRVLPAGSGNPVLMVVENKLYCCYSRFTRPMTKSVFELWQTCYTCVEQLSGTEKKQYVLSTYCCPRCNPYGLPNGDVLLPCYDESVAKGIVFKIGDGSFLERHFLIDHGKAVIQPSIFKYEDAYVILYRNFEKNLPSNPDQCYAPYSLSFYNKTLRKTAFSHPVYSKIPNHNESIVGINDKEGNAIVVYNADVGRENLTLGVVNSNKEEVLCTKNNLLISETPKASYPNCAFNEKGQLVVTFTAYDKSINNGSKICVATISTNYKKVLSRKYIEARDVMAAIS